MHGLNERVNGFVLLLIEQVIEAFEISTWRLAVGDAQLARFKREMPGVELVLHELSTAEQIEKLLRRQIHAGFLHASSLPAQLKSITLANDVFVVCLPERHRLADQPVLDLRELADEELARIRADLPEAEHRLAIAMLPQRQAQLKFTRPYLQSDIYGVTVEVLAATPELAARTAADLRALALEHNGDLYSCDHFVEPKYKLGNIHQTHMLELVASAEQRKFGQDKRDTLTAEERTAAREATIRCWRK